MPVLSPGATAKETSVGGTSMSSKEPDMQSLPPMAATPQIHLGIEGAQQRRKGLAPAVGVVRSCCSKYSWKVR